MKYRAATNSDHLYPVNENLLQGDFRTTGIGQKWVSDITYIRTGEGWLYLTVIMDLADRKIIGWSMDSSMSAGSTVVASMSRKGNCWDNAIAESFFKTLKTEMVYHTRFETRAQARLEIFDYIEIWYNRKRRHSAIDYLTLVQVEPMIAKKETDAA